MTVWRVGPGRPPVVTVHETRKRVILQLPLSDGSVAIKELTAATSVDLARTLTDAAEHARLCEETP